MFLSDRSPKKLCLYFVVNVIHIACGANCNTRKKIKSSVSCDIEKWRNTTGHTVGGCTVRTGYCWSSPLFQCVVSVYCKGKLSSLSLLNTTVFSFSAIHSEEDSGAILENLLQANFPSTAHAHLNAYPSQQFHKL
jgi:hypothetical protein